MKELQLVIFEGEKAGHLGHHIEIGIPVREPVEREGEHFIVLSKKCRSLLELQEEVRQYKLVLDELVSAAKANYRRWENESKAAAKNPPTRPPA